MKTKLFNIAREKHNIRCILYCQDNGLMTDIVIYVHGFTGHKDTKTAERLAEKLISKNKGCALIAFDLPCHGEDVKKKIFLTDCITYLDAVIEYARETLGAGRLYNNSTSFGSYLTLKYISEKENPFKKLVLRSPAIRMHQILWDSLISDEMADILNKGREIQLGFDRKISVGSGFLEELKDTDIFERDFMDYADDILIIHGTKDDLAPFDDSRDFADANVIEFLPVENADHRFSDLKKLELAHARTIEFFELP